MLTNCNRGGYSRDTKEIKRGFTLIELLAVIVILAIIALIATPIILNVINHARKSSAVDSAYGYIDAIEYQNQMNALDNVKYSGVPDGEDMDIEDIDIKVKGKAPDGGTITISKGKVSSALLCINGYNVEYTPNKAEVKNRCNASVKLLQKIDPSTTSATLDTIEIPINAVSGTTITAKAVDEQNNEVTGVIENGVVRFSGLRAGKNYRYTITATDNSGNETTRKGTLTTVSFNHIDIIPDTNDWAKKKTITLTTEENPQGTTLQYKIGSGSWTNYTQPFDVNENTTVYARLVNGENTSDEETLTITTIDNITIPTPSATVTASYPTLTVNGFSSGVGSILNITYTSQEGTSPYYSVDNGATWKKYTGETTVDSSNVKVKLVRDLSKFESKIVNATIYTTASNALNSVAYDGNLYGNATEITSEVFINVDSSMYNLPIGAAMSTNWSPYSPYNDYLQFKAYGKDSTEPLETVKFTTNGISGNGQVGKIMVIPEGTVKIGITGGGRWPQMRELTTYTTPMYSADNFYPLMKIKDNQFKVEKYNNVSIAYFPTSVEKKYKIDDGEWQDYTGTPVKVTVGSTIYMKGIDKNGNETSTSSYKAVVNGDALNPLAYDNNLYGNAVSITGEVFINVDPSMYNLSIGAAMSTNWSPYKPYNDYLQFKAYGSDSTEPLETVRFTAGGISGNGKVGKIMDIPEGTIKIGITGGGRWPEMRELTLYNS